MTKPIKRLLSAGGIAALAAGYALIGGNGEDVNELNLAGKTASKRQIIIDAEYANAKVGEELISRRTAMTKDIKTANGKKAKRIYATKKHYYDNETGTHKEYDLSIKEVSSEAKKDPKRTHDYYVDPGADAPKTTWFEGQPWNYTFIDTSGNYSVTFDAHFDTRFVTIKMEYNKNGTKEFITIADSAAAANLSGVLSWELSSTASYDLQGKEVVFVDAGEKPLFWITEPWAKDANSQEILVSVTLSGDKLTYALDISETAAYPIIIDPSIAIYKETESKTAGNSGATEATVHNASTGNSATTNYIGWYESSGTYYCYRYVARFNTENLMPHVTSIDSAKINWYTSASGSEGLYYAKIVCMNDSVNADYMNAELYNEFEGWSGTGTFTPTVASDSVDIGVAVGDTVVFKLNASGLADIKTNDKSQYMIMMAGDLSNSSAPSGLLRWETNNVWIDVYYTAQESNISYGVLDGTVEGRSGRYNTGSPDEGARDTTLAHSNDNVALKVGQSYQAISDSFKVFRSQISFSLSDSKYGNIASFDSAMIYMQTYDITNVNNLLVYIIPSTKTGTLSDGWFNDFEGWVATGAYSIDILGSKWTSVMKEGRYDEFVLTTAGKDSVMDSIGDSLHVAAICSYDKNNNTPAEYDAVTFRASYATGREPYLYLGGVTYKSPTGFTMTVVDDDSIKCDWNDIISGEDGYRIIKSPYSGPSDYVDSVGAGVETITIGNLIPNTLYTWKVQVIHDDFATTSSEDTEYTLPAIPTISSVQTLYDSTVKVYVDTTGTGNPWTTKYAFRDSLSGLLFNPVSGGLDTLGRTTAWDSLTTWLQDAPANSTYIEVYLRYSGQDGNPDSSLIGHKFNFQIKGITDG